MPLLLLSPRNIPDMERLTRAAEERGWQVNRLKGWRVPADLSADRIAIYGEPLFARIVANQLNRTLLEPPHDWLAQLPDRWTGRSICYTSLAELDNLVFPSFIKPPDDKLFPAKVYKDPSELKSRNDLDLEQPLLASAPVRFRKEYRVHVLEYRVVSVSLYCVDGEIVESSNDEHCSAASTFTRALASAHPELIPPAVVIDVGLLDDGNWAVIEANPCFGAGIYQGDASAILDVLLTACRPAEEKGFAQFKFPVELE